MSHEISPFTDQQAAALIASRDVASLLHAETKDHIITYDPAQDNSPPGTSSMDALWAKLRLAVRAISYEQNDEPFSMSLIASYAGPERKPLADTWSEALNTPEYAPYRNITAEYVGKISITKQRAPDHDDYTVYRVHEPDTVLHGLGIIIGAIMTVKHGDMEIEPNSPMAKHVGVAQDRLADIADHVHPADPEKAAGLVQAATNKDRPTIIRYTSLEPVNGWHVLDAASAETLADTIRFAAEHGSTQPQ